MYEFRKPCHNIFISVPYQIKNLFRPLRRVNSGSVVSSFRYRTGQSGNQHCDNQLDSTNWKIESTDLAHFRTSRQSVVCHLFRRNTSILAFILFSYRMSFIAVNNTMYYLKLQRLYFVSRNVWYDRGKIFDHSSSEIGSVAVASHIVMPVGFFVFILD